MKHTNRSVLGMAGLIMLCATCIFAQDWPQWRGPQRDGKVSGFTAPQTWPQTLQQTWKKTLGTGCSTPAVVGDRIYVFTRQGDNEVIQCLNEANGQQIWENKYTAQAVTGPASRHPGPRSSPAVAQGKVVTLGVGGVLSCVDAATGSLVWRKDPFPKVVPRFFTACSPLIMDGMAIAHLGGQGHGALMAFDLNSGELQWKWDGEAPEYASPALLTVAGVKQIVTLAEKDIVSVGLADGKLLWKLPFAPARMAYNAATPIVHGQTVIYTGAGRGTRAVKIVKQGDQFVPQALWQNDELAPQFNTPVLRDGLLYGLSNRGNLFCINAETGKTAWIDDTQRDRRGFGSIVSTSSCLLALCSSAEMVAFKPSAQGYTELAHIKVADTPVYAYPVIVGNRIIIKDQDSVILASI